MWLFPVHSEHVKGKEAVSEEIGNFTTNSTLGTREYATSVGVRVKIKKAAGGPSQVTA